MILEKPAFLLLLLTLPIIILIYKKSLRSRMAKESWVLVLRMLIIILLILALTKPQLKIPNNDVALMFVVDLSDSMGADTQGKIIEFINQVLVSKNEKDQVGAVVFVNRHNWNKGLLIIGKCKVSLPRLMAVIQILQRALMQL